MIAAWMMFAIEVSALLYASAWLAERVLLSVRRPVRGVWIAAIVGANLLPFVLSKLSVSNVLPASWTLSIDSESVMTRMGTPLLVIWGVAVALGCIVCATALWRMSRARPSWKSEHVDNTPVLVSHDIGPALVGVMQYSIVVPTWAYSLEENARRLLLAHEREHARKYDPLLLTGAVLAVVIAPWNVFNWVFVRRLHLAVELDCDQRVLRTYPDARGYGALLLDVAERVLPSVLPAAAFVEHGASLETRINAMTVQKKSHQSLRVVTGLAASLLFAAAACVTPRPYVIVVVPQSASAQPSAVSTATKNSQQQSVPPVAQQYVDATVRAATSRPSVSRRNDVDVAPVAPIANVKALDEQERARLFDAVSKSAPRTLGNWTRRDSALVMLFADNGTVMKQSVIAMPNTYLAVDASRVLATVFMVPEISLLAGATEVTFAKDSRGNPLDLPLKLYAGRMMPGAPTPLLRSEVVPTQKVMLATLRTRHPELGKQSASSSGALLYGSKGQLLGSAVVTVDEAKQLSDGSTNPVYVREIIRKAFGEAIDDGVIVQSGYTSASADSDGPSFAYAVFVRGAEFTDLLKAQQTVGRPLLLSGRGAPLPTKR